MNSFRACLLVLVAALSFGVAAAADDAAAPRPEGGFASRERLRECLDTEASLKARVGAIAAANEQHEQAFQRLEAENAQLRAMRTQQDEGNTAAVSAYAGLVKMHNVHVRDLNRSEAELVPVSNAYNADLTAFHARCFGLSYRAEDMDAVNADRRKAAAVTSAASAP